jgi:hypothetical protein
LHLQEPLDQQVLQEQQVSKVQLGREVFREHLQGKVAQVLLEVRAHKEQQVEDSKH